MSHIKFIAQSISLSVPLFIRFVPVLIVFAIFSVGLFAATDQELVHYITVFFLGTVGWSYLYLIGLRAGLSALRETTPANLDGIINNTAKLMFIHMLTQALIIAVVSGLAYFLFLKGPIEFAAAMAQASDGAASAQLPLLEAHHGPVMIVYVITFLTGITCTSLFGIPMASTAANAAEYSPKNDLIFGFGAYFLPQFVLSLIAVFLPMLVYFFFAPSLMAWIEGGTLGSLAIGVSALVLFSFYASWCIPMAGMALGYKQCREDVREARKAEVTPVYNVEEERENLRSLRAQRQSGSSGTKAYDPKA